MPTDQSNCNIVEEQELMFRKRGLASNHIYLQALNRFSGEEKLGFTEYRAPIVRSTY